MGFALRAGLELLDLDWFPSWMVSPSMAGGSLLHSQEQGSPAEQGCWQRCPQGRGVPQVLLQLTFSWEKLMTISITGSYYVAHDTMEQLEIVLPVATKLTLVAAWQSLTTHPFASPIDVIPLFRLYNDLC